MGINFHIGQRAKVTNSVGAPDTTQDEEDIKKFFYNFGPNRLEELLTEECDEGTRNFIKGIKVSLVRDVKSEMTTTMKRNLQ